MKKSSHNTNIEPIGFFYSVTDEQIKEHRTRSIEEILEWIESTNELVWSLQTDEERKRKHIFKQKERLTINNLKL